MCGRYFLGDSRELVVIAKEAEASPLSLRMKTALGKDLKTSGEVFPDDLVPAIALSRSGNRRVFPMAWGYRNERKLLINARFETAGQKPTFREAWKNRRCIIPASYYFEWKRSESLKAKKTSQKYLIQPKGEENTWLCGLYRFEEELPHFVILTREATPYLSIIHDRMPLILASESINTWLNPRNDPRLAAQDALTDMYFERTE